MIAVAGKIVGPRLPVAVEDPSVRLSDDLHPLFREAKMQIEVPSKIAKVFNE